MSKDLTPNSPPEGNQFAKKFKEFILSHLIASVVVGLTTVWLVTSWVVYQYEYKAQGANITSFSDSVWWGIVTFLTVGYGDKYPVTNMGRVWAGFLMLAGVLAVAILTSKISSIFLEQALREGRGIVDTARLKDHFIVCGWKDDIHELLVHILDFNRGTDASNIVLVANLPPTEVINLHEFPRLEKLQIVVGDYFQAATLKRAAPERARKVLILADRTPQPNGQIPSVTEVDARTIMTAMTLSSIARSTLVAAEILDAKMDQYLKIANVNEIIYSREYNRLLLGNASGGTGISNVIFDLLDPKTPTLLTTHGIDAQYFGKSYGEFKKDLEIKNPKVVVFGILENTGNSHRIKELALRQAQKTPDMGKLVQNLRAVKEMKCNFPIFNPDLAYIIHEGAMAIVIETRNLAGEDPSHVTGQQAVA
ncbi:ion channel [Bdellovibrionota bacterium FG-1]